MKISKFVVNPFGENTYILWDDECRDAVIIDPGMCTPDEYKAVKTFFSENKLIPKAILLTHQHVDHIMGVGFLVDEYDCEVYGHLADNQLGEKADVQVRMFNLPYNVKPFTVTHPVSDNEELSFCGETIKVLHTPGHSVGGVIYFLPQSGCAFTGDTIFQMSVGRTDLIGGNFDTLIDSIKLKVLTLPDETVLYPGHGDSTTVSDEQRYNPFLKM